MCMDSVRQELEHGTAGMACLCSTMSGTSDGNTRGQWCIDSWRLELSRGFFPPMSVLGFRWLEDRTAVIRLPSMGTPCSLASTRHGGLWTVTFLTWWLTVPGGKPHCLLRLNPRSCHLRHTLLVKAVTNLPSLKRVHRRPILQGRDVKQFEGPV